MEILAVLGIGLIVGLFMVVALHPRHHEEQ
jgi:hypothetical protein